MATEYKHYERNNAGSVKIRKKSLCLRFDWFFIDLEMDWKQRSPPTSVTDSLGLSADRNLTETEVLSNLPLQMALYFNVVFAPIWAIVIVLFLEKNYHSYDELYKYVTVTIVATICFVEILRMYLGYEGNLKDKIPELAGFWMLSLLLQFPMQGYLLFNPSFKMYVLEIVVQSIMFLLLIIQIIFGYYAMRYTALQQTNAFKLKKNLKNIRNESENPKNE